MLELLELLIKPTQQTLYMTLTSSVLAVLLGLPLGIALVVTGPDGLRPALQFNKVVNVVVNTMRSIPFIILMILLFPLSRWIVGTTIGTTASIIPLSIAAAPFVGRLVESSLLEVDRKLIEAVSSMGASPWHIVVKVLIPEALPSLVLALTVTVINIIGYSAMAGAIGGGGLGDLAIRFGFHRFQTDVLIASVVTIIVLVQAVQTAGNALAAYCSKNR